MNKPSKIKILFDANPIAISEKSGVGHYSAYLVRAIAEAYPDDLQLVGHYYNFLGHKHPMLPQAPNITYKPTKLFPGRVINMLRRFGIPIPFEWLIKSRGDILLFPNFLTQPSAYKKPIIVTIHDLCFVEHPEFVNTLNLHDLKRYVPQSLDRASLVLAVSEFTKKSIMKTFDVPCNHIIVTPVPPLGKETIADELVSKLVKDLGIHKSYILFVGNLEPRKNLGSLVEAYAACDADIKAAYSLVLAGGKGWKNEDLLARISELQSNGADIILPGYISDEQKAALYRKASVVVLPSLYEGFGMPILEAFQYSVPVVASDIPVLREVANDAVLYFDPAEISDMAKAISTVLTNSPLREVLIKKGATQLQRYSWHNTAGLIYEKFRELAS